MEHRIIVREMNCATVLWWRNQLIDLSKEQDPTHPTDKLGRRSGETFFDAFTRAINAPVHDKVDERMKNFMIILERRLREAVSRTDKIILRTDYLPMLLLLEVCQAADCLGMSFPHTAWTHLDYKAGTSTWGEFKKEGGIIFPAEKQAA